MRLPPLFCGIASHEIRYWFMLTAKPASRLCLDANVNHAVSSSSGSVEVSGVVKSWLSIPSHLPIHTCPSDACNVLFRLGKASGEGEKNRRTGRRSPRGAYSSTLRLSIISTNLSDFLLFIFHEVVRQTGRLAKYGTLKNAQLPICRRLIVRRSRSRTQWVNSTARHSQWASQSGCSRSE